MKRCNRCMEWKEEDDFPRKGSRRHGFCKDCHSWAVNKRMVSLDRRSRFTGKELHGRVEARPLREQTDATWEKVCLALAYWIRTKAITKAQAEAIYLYAVEGLSFREIGTLCECSWTNVQMRYHDGIRRLQERYHDTFIKSDDRTAQNERRSVTEGVTV